MAARQQHLGWLPVGQLATQLRDRLAGRNLRVSDSGEVHGTREIRWIGGHRIPAPACGTAIGNLNPGQWHPTMDPVTCLHCIRIHAGTDPEPAPVVAQQLELFDPAA